MEHLTPAELLRFLEEEANTLQLMNAKIANQLHHLQVEEELYSRQLSNLEKGKERATLLLEGKEGASLLLEGKEGASLLLDEFGQSEQDVNGNQDNEDNVQAEIWSEGHEPRSPALDRSTAQALGSSPEFQESPATRNRFGAGGQELSETIELENEHGVEKELQSQQ